MGRAFARVACLLMAIMALAVIAPPPAQAATGKATVVIKNDGTYDDAGDFAADFYQIFSASTLDDGTVVYTLEKPFDEFFKSNEKYGCTGLDGNDLSDAAYEYVVGLKGAAGREEQADKLVEFSCEVLQWLRAKGPYPKYPGVRSTGDTLTQEVEPGYYVVRIEYSSSRNAILINAVNGTVESNIKMEHVPLQKEVAKGESPREEDFGPSVDASFGDTLTFRLKTKVQDPFGYSATTAGAYAIYVNDYPKDRCLRFGKITSLTMGGTDYLDNKEVLNQSISEGALTFYIRQDYLQAHPELIGQEIVVTYTALVDTLHGLSGNAVNDGFANRNDAYDFRFTVDSNGDSKQGPHVHADVYSSRIVIDKFEGEYGQPNSAHLAGAAFELRKGEAPDSEVYKFYSMEENKYRIADSQVIAGGSGVVTQFTTPDSGQVTLEGLGAGEYWLHEVTPPAGFKKLAKPVKIIVKANYDTDTKALTSWEFSYDMNDGGGEKPAVANKVTPDDGSNVIPVLNKKSQGDPLPDTGGIGVVPFLIVGATVVAGGAYWMRSRMVNDR